MPEMTVTERRRRTIAQVAAAAIYAYGWAGDAELEPAGDLLAADDFNHADGDPGPNWVLEDPTFVIVSGRLVHTGGRDFIAWATAMPTADYYVEADVWGYGGPGNDTSQYVIVHGRANGFGDNNCYMGYIHPTTGDLVIGKLVGYAYSDVATAPYTRHTPPTRLRLEMQGTALRLYADGVLVVSATDTDITAAGQPGLNASSSGGAEHPPQYDNFAVGALE